MASAHRLLARARLYLVCDAIDELRLEAVLREGVGAVQLRCKAADERRILALAARLAPLCHRHGALFILNDRPDLVPAAGADGAHVGQDDMPVAQARRLLGADRILGLSTHTPAQVEAAARAPVDYIGVGPVYATPTKSGRPAVGLELVRYAAAHAQLPFFAIGGVSPETAAAVRDAGASRLAVVRALTEAPDPAGAARSLREALTRRPAEVGSGAA